MTYVLSGPNEAQRGSEKAPCISKAQRNEAHGKAALRSKFKFSVGCVGKEGLVQSGSNRNEEKKRTKGAGFVRRLAESCRALHLVYCSAVSVLKFLTFLKRVLDFSFLADPTDYAVGPAE